MGEIRLIMTCQSLSRSKWKQESARRPGWAGPENISLSIQCQTPIRFANALLDSQYLRVLIVADSDPVGLRGAPLDLIDLTLGGRVGQDGVFNGTRHLLDVPD